MSMTLHRDLRIFSAWLFVASSAAMLQPWSAIGWQDGGAILGPVALLGWRALSRDRALAIGLPALALLWIFEVGTGSWLRLGVDWAVFGIGVLLAARVVRSQIELEAIAGRVSLEPQDPGVEARFREAIDRELGRARRHERPFAILAAAAHPRTIEVDPSGRVRSDVLQSLAENRARLELREFLREQLHVYAEVVVGGPGVRALVPETDRDTLAVLLGRLGSEAEERLDFDVQIGAACFPSDALCADDLIDSADRHVAAWKTRRPEPITPDEPKGSRWRSPRAQG